MSDDTGIRIHISQEHNIIQEGIVLAQSHSKKEHDLPLKVQEAEQERDEAIHALEEATSKGIRIPISQYYRYMFIIQEAEQQRDEAIHALEEATGKYNEDVKKNRARIAELQERAHVESEKEVALASAILVRSRHRAQHEENERKIAEWKERAAQALKDCKDRENALAAQVKDLAGESSKLRSQLLALRSEVEVAEAPRRPTTNCDEAQTDDGESGLTTTAAPPAMSEVMLSVRYSLSDLTFLETKISVPDSIVIENLVSICCNKISIKANRLLDPDIMCLRFTLASQSGMSPSGSLSQHAKGALLQNLSSHAQWHGLCRMRRHATSTKQGNKERKHKSGKKTRKKMSHHFSPLRRTFF